MKNKLGKVLARRRDTQNNNNQHNDIQPDELNFESQHQRLSALMTLSINDKQRNDMLHNGLNYDTEH
jgi:hypothetical protein